MHGPERYGNRQPAPLFQQLPAEPTRAPTPPPTPPPAEQSRGTAMEQMQRELLGLVADLAEVAQSLRERVNQLESEQEAQGRRIGAVENAMEVH